MFGFKKKVKHETLGAIASGQLMAITAVADQVFSQKMMGDGVAIEPTADQIVAPADGEITMIADTKHAIMMTTTEGLELMLHLGLDTVELQGKPFTVAVKVGDHVEAGAPLATMDLAAVKAAGKGTTVMTVVTNMDLVEQVDKVPDQAVQTGATVATVTLK
ncbi:PTS sugar transporter subunit IIA [Lactiplantibacillus pingfangensis]|uniref:PTS sugar transporter subunit IIA n=1 Tax=Lactiplantibacillus pingfangensis TaxID=2559915 RepID=UPI0010F93DBD|nr:PTS glucose transporter subunit IIA [Lactiplantibacillus pingfangensis]